MKISQFAKNRYLGSAVLSLLFSASVLVYAQEPQGKTAIEKMYNKETRTIHLDKDDPSIDVTLVSRDMSQDNRAPGLMNVQRYDLILPFQGIPTFFKLPVALTPEDLKAAKVDVALVGNLVTGGTGRPGATMAASWVRMGEPLIGGGAGMNNTNAEIQVDPFRELTVVDYGDLGVDPMSPERSLVHLAEEVQKIAETGTVPILIGGDHATLYPTVVAMGRTHGKGNFSLIHIDAHADNSGSTIGHYSYIGNPNRLALTEGWVKGENHIQLGLRAPFYSADYINWWPENKAHLYMMAEVENRGFREVQTEISEILKNGPGKVYVSIDIDVLEPGLAPAVTGPEPGGLTTRQLIELIRTVAVSSEVIGMEFIEYVPQLDDQAGTTRMVVSRLVRESLGGIALRKKGIREPFYYAPITDSKTRRELLNK